jgi:hypothetical protein
MQSRAFSRLAYTNVAGTAALVLAIGAFVSAAIPGPDGLIHACYRKRGGKLRAVQAGTACQKSETAIAWSQEGPAGQNGQDGAPATKLWAVVNSAGSLVRGSGVAVPTGSDLSAPGNTRRVPFNRDLTGCAWVAMIGGADVLSGTVTGFINASLVDAQTIEVDMSNTSGSVRLNQDFHLAVFC